MSARRAISRLRGAATICTCALLMAIALPGCGSSKKATGTATTGATAAAPPSAPAGATAAAGRSYLTPVVSGPPCGHAAAATLAHTAGHVAKRIYEQELSSSVVFADRGQVQGYAPLLSALARRQPGAVRQAVIRLVYSHTHIVRLRVSQDGHVLADVGGPYILAPVSGTLRFHGRTVGSYVLSVQDDLGYVKLEKRFIGDPLALYAGSTQLPLEGTLPPEAGVPESGGFLYAGRRYQVASFPAKAFPSGSVRISLLLPVSSSLGRDSCAQIKIAELTHIAERIWRRFTLAKAPLQAHVNAVSSLTGGLSYVRAGSYQLAGSTQPGPPVLPPRGTVRYRGLDYVVSFPARTPSGLARVYLLAER